MKGGDPTLPDHVLVRCYLGIYAHLEFISIPGVMQILEDTQGWLRGVPEDETRLLRKPCDSDISLERTGSQLQGQLIQVVGGRLRGISGVLQNETKTSLLIPIHTLQMNVAVEIDRAQLLPYAKRGEPRGGSSYLIQR